MRWGGTSATANAAGTGSCTAKIRMDRLPRNIPTCNRKGLPSTDVEYQRAKSDMNQAELPRAWLSKVTDYARGPLNEFNKPLGGQNVKYRGKTESSIAAARVAVEAIENRTSISTFG